MEAGNQQRKFRVLIVGGGIAGLTLANALQHAGIDYLLLEARSELAPQIGASIGLGPNGSRILDQLGCYDDIMELTEPIDFTGSHNDDGDYIRPKTDAFKLVQARSNYCMCFLDRQSVLQILAEHIADRSKVLLDKRLVKAEHGPKGVTVACLDGTSYEGDILVGADGIFSTVRQEMWRAADAESPGAISDIEKGTMLAEYKCLFAISTPNAHLPTHEFGVTYKKDISPIVITGKDGRVYWFLIARMPQIYRAENIPRFSKEDAKAFAEDKRDIPVMPGGTVTVGDLWKTAQTYNLVALEEAYYSTWTYGRYVCLGDSIHKMTPNMGAGGNSAIESAAALANSLQEMLSRPGSNPSSTDTVREAMLRYQETRKGRASSTVKVANLVTRLHAMRGFIERIIAYYIMPNAGDLLVDLASDSWIGAIRLEYLPIPKRSLGGTMPFNPEQGMGKNENPLYRALVASPFLGLGMFHFQLVKRLLPRQMMRAASVAGRLTLGTVSVPLHNGFYHINFIDALWRGIAVLYVPSTMGLDIGGSWQMTTCLADFGTVYAILMIESARRANLLTPMAM
jgi:2-polyprenyl-6-methoxyphenol hydroxylase-like FAD-dependent oxidoreductase